MNNVRKFDYKDTDKKIEIEIYGLRFTINTRVISNKNINEINTEDEDIILKEIDEILGNNAVNKINDKRNKDGYEDMDINVQLAVLGCIYETYVNATTDAVVDGMLKTYDDKLNKVNNMGNREQRRNYNRGKNNSRINNRYRRY